MANLHVFDADEDRVPAVRHNGSALEIPRWVKEHYPMARYGYAWGYHGEGTLMLALAMLDAVHGREYAEDHAASLVHFLAVQPRVWAVRCEGERWYSLDPSQAGALPGEREAARPSLWRRLLAWVRGGVR